MRKKILLFGHYGVPNWGDEAILQGILKNINIQKYSVTVVTNDKKFTKHHHGVKGIYPPAFGIRSVFRGGFFTFLSELNSADYILFGGGGLFQDKPQKALSIWKYYLNWCIWKRKKIFFIGNSFEKIIETSKSTSLEKKFRAVKFFSVRDQSSKKILQSQYNVPSLKISETTDGAYFLEPNVKPGRKKGLLLSFREGEIDEKKEKKIIRILQEYFPKEFENNTVEVLVMQEKNSGDSLFARRHNLPIFLPDSVDQLREKIRSSKTVITTRLHAGILANIASTSFIAISNRKKITEFFGENFSISLSKIFTKAGEKKFRTMIKSLPTTKAAQKNFLMSQQKKLNTFFPDFLSL